MSQSHPGQDPAQVLKPLHPRAARPALERVLAQGQAQGQLKVQETEAVAQIYTQLLAGDAPSLPAEARSLIARFARQPNEREQILERLLKLVKKA